MKKISDTVKKVKEGKVYKLYKGGRDVVRNIKEGKFGKAVKAGSDTIKSLKNKKKKNNKKD